MVAFYISVEWYWNVVDSMVLLLQYCGITKLLQYE